MSERLGEAPPCFLITKPTVELVCVSPPLRCGEEDETAAAPTRLLLHRGDERLADTASTVSLIDDYRAELGRRAVVLEREADMDTRQPNNLPLYLSDD